MRKPIRIATLAVAATLVAGALAIVTALPAAAGESTAVAGGNDHTCAITPQGGLRCWGNDGDGQLGDPTTGDSPTPVKVKNMSKGVVAVAAGWDHSCAIKGPKRTLFCWGANWAGQLGVAGTQDRHAPVKVRKMSKGVVAVAAGADHTCAIKAPKNTLSCWGYNEYGQVGDGGVADRFVPVKVKKMNAGVVAIATGFNHTCAIKGAKRALFCWGQNYEGQVGDGTTGHPKKTPVKVKGLNKGVVAIAPGHSHTCAIKGAKRTLFCWGKNLAGQLGDGTESLSQPDPRKVKKMAKGVVAASGAGEHTCAIKGAKRTLFCWGGNQEGELGIGTSGLPRTTPVKVKKLVKDVSGISTGSSHSCALKDSKHALFCWGRNDDGQVGDGTSDDHPAPVKIKL